MAALHILIASPTSAQLDISVLNAIQAINQSHCSSKGYEPKGI